MAACLHVIALDLSAQDIFAYLLQRGLELCIPCTLTRLQRQWSVLHRSSVFCIEHYSLFATLLISADWKSRLYSRGIHLVT